MTVIHLSIGPVEVREPTEVELANVRPLGFTVADCVEHLVDLVRLGVVGRYALASAADAREFCAGLRLSDLERLVSYLYPDADWSLNVLSRALEELSREQDRGRRSRSSLFARGR